MADDPLDRNEPSTWKSAPRATREGPEDSAETSVQQSLTMRASRAGHIHHERAGQRNRDQSKKQRPSIYQTEHEQCGGNGQAQNRYLDEDLLPPLDEAENIEFEVPRHL